MVPVKLKTAAIQSPNSVETYRLISKQQCLSNHLEKSKELLNNLLHFKTLMD